MSIIMRSKNIEDFRGLHCKWVKITEKHTTSACDTFPKEYEVEAEIVPERKIRK
ncbi:hypothetical protein OAF54_00950 [bacterium]|nr:hypothetical protein [bacterium]